MKLIAVDLDGTLLNHKNEISKENAAAIKYAQSEGIEVVIATGRNYVDVKSICNKANISTYIISNNGAVIHSRNGDQLSSISINKNHVKQVIEFLEKNNFYYEISNNSNIFTPHKGRELLQKELNTLEKENPKMNKSIFDKALEKQFGQLGFMFFTEYNQLIESEEEFYNILAFSFDEAKRKTGMEYTKTMNILSVFSSGDYNFEMVNTLTSKGNSLEKLASMLNIPLSECMAIGDSYNDISMFQKANYSVAMGNAKDDIKRLCKFITSTNDNNGVADIIYLLNPQAMMDSCFDYLNKSDDLNTPNSNAPSITA